MNRSFERLFPGIAAEDKMYEQDLLADGKMAANRNRQLRERGQQSTDNAT